MAASARAPTPIAVKAAASAAVHVDIGADAPITIGGMAKIAAVVPKSPGGLSRGIPIADGIFVGLKCRRLWSNRRLVAAEQKETSSPCVKHGVTRHTALGLRNSFRNYPDDKIESTKAASPLIYHYSR
jgi:hypothetical protein